MTESSTPSSRGFAGGRGLVVYASTHGHTAKIAARIATTMRAQGLVVDLRRIDDATDVYPASYDVVVVGASVHKERHQPEIVHWVKARRGALQDHPSALFSVSLSAAEDTEESRAATQRCIDEFIDESGWTPTRTAPIAGCLQYREYDMFTRQLMRLLMRRMGHPTDASHDYDYTDWDAVDRFGVDIAALACADVGTRVSSA